MKKILAFLAALPFSLNGVSADDHNGIKPVLLIVVGAGVVVLIGIYVFGIGV